jgi:hypothetical protein
MFGSLFKGRLSEKATQFGLWQHLDEQVYRRFHDVIVPARNGTTLRSLRAIRIELPWLKALPVELLLV